MIEHELLDDPRDKEFFTPAELEEELFGGDDEEFGDILVIVEDD